MGNFYEDIAGNIAIWFDTSSYSKDHYHPLPIGENKKVMGLMKDKLGRRIVTKFVALRLKLYAYETFSGRGDKKCKRI